MINFAIFSLVYLSFALGGLSSRTLSDGVVFSVGVLGRHGNIRKMSLNSLAYLIGVIIVIAPVVALIGIGVRSLIDLQGRSYVVAALIVSGLTMASSVINILVQRNGFSFIGESINKNRLKRKRVSLSRSVGTFRSDLLFGLLSGGRIIWGELGVLIGGIWLLESISGFGITELVTACLLLSSFMVMVFMMLLYGMNVASLERLRKRFALRLSLAGASAGIIIAWSVVAFMMGII